jgi:predicted amino acid dehydrogenase
MTDLGRSLTQRKGLTFTTGHATTASAVVLTSLAAAQATGRDLSDETVAFIGLGAIGSATLQLMLDRHIVPRSLILCDVRAKTPELQWLAEDIRKRFGAEVVVVCAAGSAPDQVYRSSFIVGATNMPGVLDVDKLAAGTIVVDDSFPHCFNTAHAIGRMSTRGDVLLADGGFVSPPGTMEWHMTLPAGVVPGIGNLAEAALPPSSTVITGCILSPLLLKAANAPATIGPVDVATSRDHWQAMQRMGIGAAPFRCGNWMPDAAYLQKFRAQFGRMGG